MSKSQRASAPGFGTIARSTLVALGPSMLLDLAGTACTVLVLPDRLRRRGPGEPRPPRPVRLLIALGAAFPWVYLFGLRPWHRRWGATQDEVGARLPGDDSVPEVGYQHTRAVTVHAPAAAVWGWLAQIGRGRGGFYSYDWLENLAGVRVRSAEEVRAEWQLQVGDTVEVLPGWGPRVAAVEPERALIIENWGAYAVRPLNAHTTRLIARARQPRGLGTLVYLLTIEIPHFVMERRMLLGIKERAERGELPRC